MPVLCKKYPVSRCGCGPRLENWDCIHKMVFDFDKCRKMVTFTAVLHPPVVSDRNQSYNALANRQCCWRHLATWRRRPWTAAR